MNNLLKRTKKIKDHILIGVIVSIVATTLSIIILKVTLFDQYSLKRFLAIALELKVHLKIISIAIYFSNLGLFFLALKINKLKIAKGVMIATIIFTFATLLNNILS